LEVTRLDLYPQERLDLGHIDEGARISASGLDQPTGARRTFRAGCLGRVGRR
jgi:hypothetical protein